MNKRRRALVGVIAILAFAGPEAAQADTKSVGDGNDVPTALDIRSVAQGHAGKRVTHTLRTYGRFSSRFLRNGNFIAFAFDTNGTPGSVERYAFVVYGGGRLRGVVTKTNRDLDFVALARVSRPNSHSVKIKITRASLRNPVGYGWVGFAIVGSRGDAAPNRGLVLHDITAPKITFPVQGIPEALPYDVTFSVSDKGGAGLRSWRLEQRGFGTTAWSLARSGTSTGAKSVSITASEGDDHQFRIVAVDRQGNRRVSRIRTVSVPVDDANAAVVYAGTGWAATTAVGGAFLQTLHTTATNADSFTYTFDGSRIAIVGPSTCAAGTVTIDTDPPESLADPCNGKARQILYRTSLPAGPHTLTFVSTSATAFSLDGLISR